MAVISTQGLTKQYGNNPPALKNVTIDIPDGVTGLLGPNGAGKSTLLQCVLGLLPDFRGDATVLGKNTRKERRALRRNVGFMPETDTYIAGMTGIRAVRYLGQLGGMPYTEALRRAHEVLFHVGLGEAIYRKVTEYSTGMRQRFKLAQALVHDPDLLLLDEPLSGLDPKGRVEVLNLITDLATNHGKHVVWSSHILPDVQRVAEHVVILHHGEYHGTHRLDALASTQGQYALDVEGDTEALGVFLGDRSVTFDVAPSEDVVPGGRVTWTVSLPDGVGPAALLSAAAETGARVRRLTPVRESLEDVFLRVLDGPTEAA